MSSPVVAFRSAGSGGDDSSDRRPWRPWHAFQSIVQRSPSLVRPLRTSQQVGVPNAPTRFRTIPLPNGGGQPQRAPPAEIVPQTLARMGQRSPHKHSVHERHMIAIEEGEEPEDEQTTNAPEVPLVRDSPKDSTLLHSSVPLGEAPPQEHSALLPSSVPLGEAPPQDFDIAAFKIRAKSRVDDAAQVLLKAQHTSAAVRAAQTRAISCVGRLASAPETPIAGNSPRHSVRRPGFVPWSNTECRGLGVANTPSPRRQSRRRSTGAANTTSPHRHSRRRGPAGSPCAPQARWPSEENKPCKSPRSRLIAF